MVAVINGTMIVYLSNESNDTVWSGKVDFICYCGYQYSSLSIGDIPGDGSPIDVLLPVKYPLVVGYYLLATIGICFALVCLLFNIIFRKRK